MLKELWAKHNQNAMLRKALRKDIEELKKELAVKEGLLSKLETPVLRKWIEKEREKINSVVQVKGESR